MVHHHIPHIPIYEGDEDPKLHWFIYKITWDATNVTGTTKKIAQFAESPRKRVLTWYMNFTENKKDLKLKSNRVSSPSSKHKMLNILQLRNSKI